LVCEETFQAKNYWGTTNPFWFFERWRGARLDPTEETDAIDWKRSAEQRYPLRRISKNCTPYRFSMLCLSLTNSPFRPSSSAVGGVHKQTHPFTDYKEFLKKVFVFIPETERSSFLVEASAHTPHLFGQQIRRCV
jgi:hypothetical protein